jgi:hypothetical protein
VSLQFIEVKNCEKSFDFLKNHLIFLKIAHGPLFPVLHYLIPFSAIGCCHRNTVTCDSSVLVSYSGVTRSLLSLKVSSAHLENFSFSSLLLLSFGSWWCVECGKHPLYLSPSFMFPLPTTLLWRLQTCRSSPLLRFSRQALIPFLRFYVYSCFCHLSPER